MKQDCFVPWPHRRSAPLAGRAVDNPGQDFLAGPAVPWPSWPGSPGWPGRAAWLSGPGRRVAGLLTGTPGSARRAPVPRLLENIQHNITQKKRRSPVWDSSATVWGWLRVWLAENPALSGSPGQH